MSEGSIRTLRGGKIIRLSTPSLDETEDQRIAREAEEQKKIEEAEKAIEEEEQLREKESEELLRLSNENDSLKNLVSQLQEQFEQFKLSQQPMTQGFTAMGYREPKHPIAPRVSSVPPESPLRDKGIRFDSPSFERWTPERKGREATSETE